MEVVFSLVVRGFVVGEYRQKPAADTSVPALEGKPGTSVMVSKGNNTARFLRKPE